MGASMMPTCWAMAHPAHGRAALQLAAGGRELEAEGGEGRAGGKGQQKRTPRKNFFIFYPQPNPTPSNKIALPSAS